MSLDLDERQRALLREMGVQVWWPAREVEVLALAEAPRQATPPPAALAVETPTPDVLAAGDAVESQIETGPADQGAATPADRLVTDMDWPMLAQAVAACQQCLLCTGRRAPVFGAAQARHPADWLVVGDPPDEAEERAGTPFVEQAGQLLDNMLKALGVRRQDPAAGRAGAAYVTNVVKCRPAAVRNPTPQELAACANYLRREVALVQPKVILALGRFAAQALLQDSLPEVGHTPLGKLRGRIYRYQGIPVVVSYHPSYLLRSQHDKARAWADLCLALDALRRGE